MHRSGTNPKNRMRVLNSNKRTSKMNKNLYTSHCSAINDIFNRVGKNQDILIVPFDYAKSSFASQFILASGEMISNPMTIFNNPRGYDFLQKKLTAVMERYKIKKGNVIFAGEDLPSYALTFINALKKEGYLVTWVNALKTSKQDIYKRSKSDKSDLLAIAQMVLNRQAFKLDDYDEVFIQLKQSSRMRSQLVRANTSIKNQIHSSCDLLFPGFLKRGSPIFPFSLVSLSLMKAKFSTTQIKKQAVGVLTKKLTKYGAKQAPQKALELKSIAEDTLEIPPALESYYSDCLSSRVELYQAQQELIAKEENNCLRALIQSPAILVLSIPGMGLNLTSVIFAELASIRPEGMLEKSISYAGCIPRETQTGGPDKDAITLSLPFNCNKRLKNALIQAAYHTGNNLLAFKGFGEAAREHYLYKHYQQVLNRGGSAKLSTAKLLLNIILKIANQRRIYTPDYWLKNSQMIEAGDTELYYEFTYQNIKEKIAGYDLSGIPDEHNYLLKFKKEIDEISTINTLT